MGGGYNFFSESYSAPPFSYRFGPSNHGFRGEGPRAEGRFLPYLMHLVHLALCVGVPGGNILLFSLGANTHKSRNYPLCATSHSQRDPGDCAAFPFPQTSPFYLRAVCFIIHSISVKFRSRYPC